MEDEKDSPGVRIPPPTFFIIAFVLAWIFQRVIPVSKDFFRSDAADTIGYSLILLSLLFGIPALAQFIRTRNTPITYKPSTSLQTTGLFAFSRNPMYIGLFLFYAGVSLIAGNWWNFLLIPALFIVVQEYIIKHEEKYLERKFGQQYSDYRKKVRRWL